MWELVSIVLGIAVFMLIFNYVAEPEKLIEDIKSIKGSPSKIEELEKRIEALEKAMAASKSK